MQDQDQDERNASGGLAALFLHHATRRKMTFTLELKSLDAQEQNRLYPGITAQDVKVLVGGIFYEMAKIAEQAGEDLHASVRFGGFVAHLTTEPGENHAA